MWNYRVDIKVSWLVTPTPPAIGQMPRAIKRQPNLIHHVTVVHTQRAPNIVLPWIWYQIPILYNHWNLGVYGSCANHWCCTNASKLMVVTTSIIIQLNISRCTTLTFDIVSTLTQHLVPSGYWCYSPGMARNYRENRCAQGKLIKLSILTSEFIIYSTVKWAKVKYLWWIVTNFP